jgi:hypothetical protein
VRDTWPAALRKRTLPYFEYQGIANQISRNRWIALEHLPVLHRVLRETDLETLPLWMLGPNADHLHIAERVAARDPSDAEALAVRGVAALARRDYPAASGLLDVAWHADPAEFSRLYWWIYSLCAEGRCDEAMQVANAEREHLPNGARDRVFWHWMRRAFGIEPPL